MRPFGALLFFALSLAAADQRTGAMYISRIEGAPSHQGIFADGHSLYASRKRSNFEFFENGTLKLSGSESYLAVDDAGKFVLIDWPDASFSLTAIEGLTTMRSLTYNGTNLFQICGDNSMGYKSTCDDSEKAVVTFEDL